MTEHSRNNNNEFKTIDRVAKSFVAFWIVSAVVSIGVVVAAVWGFVQLVQWVVSQ